MSKKTKKRNPQQLKAEQARNKNLYLKRIKEMFAILGYADVWELLGKDGIEFFHRYHLRPLKFINPTEGIKLPNKHLKIINEQFSHLLKNHRIQLGPDKREVSYYDFYTLIETIYFFWRNCCKLEYQNSSAFKARLNLFNEEFSAVREEVHESIDELLFLFMWMMSDITHVMVWMEHEDKRKSTDRNDIYYNNYVLHIERPEIVTVELDSIKRSVFRVGMIDLGTGVTWMEIKSEKLGMNGILSQLPLKVFIQQHAIERIKERLGSFGVGLECTLIITSLIDNNISRTHHGGFLFAVNYLSSKLGYLKADVVGDILVIRTFLFLTNNGTPEGDKLEELLGIQKEDKRYLGIDKLDTFIRSDIEQNPELKELFIKAGCGHLFKLKKNKSTLPDTKLNCAKYISNYLGLNKEEPVCLV